MHIWSNGDIGVVVGDYEFKESYLYDMALKVDFRDMDKVLSAVKDIHYLLSEQKKDSEHFNYEVGSNIGLIDDGNVFDGKYIHVMLHTEKPAHDLLLQLSNLPFRIKYISVELQDYANKEFSLCKIVKGQYPDGVDVTTVGDIDVKVFNEEYGDKFSVDDMFFDLVLSNPKTYTKNSSNRPSL